MKSLPMVKLLLPFAAGIVLGEHFALPWWFVVAAFSLCGVLALLLRSGAALAALLVATGWGVCQFHAPERTVPLETMCLWQMQVEGMPAGRGRYSSADGVIRAWRLPGRTQWHTAADRVVLRTDSTVVLSGGDRILCWGRVGALRGGSESYRRLMARRGFVGSLYLSSRRVLESGANADPGLHLRAAARMKRICSPDDAGAVLRAMTVADRSGLTPRLRAAWSRSGMSHLLAVSGLHTGLVFLLANLALRWLALLRRGHLVRDALAVGAVWLYVATAGFPPSAVRAAVMCTLLQAALAVGSEYVGLNALAAAAFGMLLWNPAWIGDIGFQLSFVAVAAILLWAVPLCRRLHGRHRVLNALTDTVAVGAVATLATAPLVSHAFGVVPVAGLLLNPAVIPLAGIVVLCGVAGLFVPEICRAGEGAADLLDLLARTTASVPGAAVEYALSTRATVACYVFFVIATAVLRHAAAKKNVHLPS